MTYFTEDLSQLKLVDKLIQLAGSPKPDLCGDNSTFFVDKDEETNVTTTTPENSDKKRKITEDWQDVKKTKRQRIASDDQTPTVSHRQNNVVCVFDYFLLEKKAKLFPLQGLTPNDITINLLDCFSYKHRDVEKNVMMIWVKNELTKRCKRVKLRADRLSSKSVYYSGPKISSDDHINLDIRDEIILKCNTVIQDLHNFWIHLVKEFYSVCDCMQHIIAEKCFDIETPASLKENHHFGVVEECFGKLWSTSMHECTRLDLLILCKAMSDYFDTPLHMMETLLGFDKKYPFFHQQEGVVHFFWSILRPSLMMDKNSFFMDHMGTGKTFQAIINMRAYQVLFGWLSSITVLQSFNTGLLGSFLARDKCLFDIDAVNEYNVWCNYIYTFYSKPQDIESIKKKISEYTFIASVENENVGKVVTKLFSSKGLHMPSVQHTENSSHGIHTKFHNCDTVLSDYIISEIEREFQHHSNQTKKEDIALYEKGNAIFGKGINLCDSSRLATMLGENITLPDDFSIEPQHLSTKHGYIPECSENHEDILKVIFKDHQEQNVDITPPDFVNVTNTNENIYLQTFGDELISKIMTEKSISYLDAIQYVSHSPNYMSLAGLDKSDFSAVDVTLRTPLIDNINSIMTKDNKDKICDRITVWMKCLLSAKTKAWDLFFCPKEFVNLPPLIVIPKGSITVWLEEFYKSIDSAEVAIINNALKEEIYGIIRKETNLSNTEIEFGGKTLVGEKENWYSSARLVYSAPSSLDQMNNNFDFALIHIDGLETENKLIKSFIDSFSNDISMSITYLDSIKNTDFKQLVYKHMTFWVYFREVNFFISVQENIKKLKQREEWKSYAKLHKYLKLVLSGCKKYLSTYNTPGFFLNILRKTFQKDWCHFLTLIRQKYAVKPNDTVNKSNVPTEIDVFIQRLKKINVKVIQMDKNLPAFTAYIMNSSYCLNMDEAHTIRNINQTWSTFVSIPTDIRSFLTGTPLNNNESKELINVIKMVNRFGPFSRTLELSHVNIYEKSEYFYNVHDMMLNTHKHFHDNHLFEQQIWFAIYKNLPRHLFYNRNYPFLFLGDRVVRAIPHNVKWTNFSEHLGNEELFHNCTQHKCHNSLDRKQLWKNVESYQSKASSSTANCGQGYTGDINHFFKPVEKPAKRKLTNNISSANLEKYNKDDIWSDNARAHIVDVMGRRVTMNSPWNMGGIPLSLVYAHNNTRAKASVCKICGSCARPFSEYKDFVTKSLDDINTSTEDIDTIEIPMDMTDDLNDTTDYDEILQQNPRLFDHKQIFGIMRNKSPYHPKNFSCGAADYLYKYECIMISNNVRSLWFNPPIANGTTSRNDSCYLPVVVSSSNNQIPSNLGDIAVKYGVGSERYKKAIEKAINDNPSTNDKKNKGKGKSKLRTKSCSDEKAFTEKLKSLMTDMEKRHSIRNDMQTSALCECFSTLKTEMAQRVSEVTQCLTSVYTENVNISTPNSNLNECSTIPDLSEEAKLFMFMINYNGMRFQNSFGGCIRHNPYTLHSDSLLSDDVANAVDDLQLITMALVDTDFKDMLLYRFIQSSVVLFTKYKKHMAKRTQKDKDDSALNLEDFHVWYYLHSGEALKDTNMYKSDARRAHDIVTSLFGENTKNVASKSRSWYSDKFILHDDENWLTENDITNKNSLEIESLDSTDIKQISSLVAKLIESHRSKIFTKIAKHLPKYYYRPSSTDRSCADLSKMKDIWHKYTCIFWGKFIPKPVIYKVCMSPEELEVYKYYIYGENMKKEDNQLLKELTLAANGKIKHEIVKKANKLLFSTTKNAMICCENYFQKMPKRYSQYTNMILEEIGFTSDNSNNDNKDIDNNSDDPIYDSSKESDIDDDESNESEEIDDPTTSFSTDQQTVSENNRKMNKTSSKHANSTTAYPKNQKRDLYSQKLLDVFKTFNYAGRNILHPVYGFFDPSKMPSKYHGIVSYILSRTNICEQPVPEVQKGQNINKPVISKDVTSNILTVDSRDFLIIYVQTVQYVDHLASYLLKLLGIKCSIYVGSGSSRKKSKFYELKTFQDGGTRILIASLKIAGASLNIPRANHVLFTLAWWNPQLEEQAKARIVRANQMKEVNFGIIVMNNALDEIIIDTGDKKEKGISGIFKNSSGIVRADASKYVYIHVDHHKLSKAFSKHLPTPDINQNIKIMRQSITPKFVDAPDISLQDFRKGILSSLDNNGNLDTLSLFKSNTGNISLGTPFTRQPNSKIDSSSNKTVLTGNKSIQNDCQINTSTRIGRFLEATKRLKVIEPNMNEKDQ